MKVKILFLVFLVPLILWLGTGAINFGWDRGDSERFNVYEETLTITAAGGADTTKFFRGDRFMQICPLPGASANKDSFSQAASGDSMMVDVFIEGWTDKNGTGSCLGKIQVWNPFKMGTYATASNYDSSYKVVDLYSGLTLARPITQYTAGTGDWDSTHIDLRTLENRTMPVIWPWCRIIIYDADTKCAKNYATRMRVYGYTP